MKTTKELRSLGELELGRRLTELRKELLKLNADTAAASNPALSGRHRSLRRNLARVLTLQRESQSLLNKAVAQDQGKRRKAEEEK